MASTTRRGSLGDDTPEEPVLQAEEPEVEVEPEEEETPDPTQEIFDGGPTYAVVEEWKKIYGDVYITSFGPDRHYIWRTLNRSEYRDQIKRVEVAVASGQISQAEANLNNEEQIAERCILFPVLTRQQIVIDMAGVASVIAQEIMEASGFVAMDVRQL